MKIAVLGLGRSGLSVALTAKNQGSQVTVFDAKTDTDLSVQDQIKELHSAGIEFVGDFNDNSLPEPFDEIVTSPGVDMRKPILRDASRHGIHVISEIEFAYRIARAPMIAITGTNGKSTTTAMTYLALRSAGIDAVLCGNIWGTGYPEIPLTEAAAASKPGQVLVAEVSSFQLEWVYDFRPKCAGITNISPDHLNRYDSFDQYAQTKRRIFDKMGLGDTIVANAGDSQTYPSNQSLRDRGAGLPKVRFYSAAGGDASFDSYALKLSVVEPITELPFSERHNLLNACHASLLALSYLESIEALNPQQRTEKVLEGLRQFKGLAHRMERLGQRDRVVVINNSMCTNPEAIIASSSGLAKHQHLLIGGIKKNYEFGPVGKYLSQTEHQVYLFGQDREDIQRELGKNWPLFATMEEAFAAATEKAKADEVIMLAPGCASMDLFKDFVHRGEAFRKTAMEWLNGKATTHN